MTNENIENWGRFLDRLITDRPSAIHNSISAIAEACADQMHDLMPGCKVRIIVEDADIEAHQNPEKQVIGSGVAYTTKVGIANDDQKEYLLITTDTNND